jgi:ABC-type nitrate/sulfonate/bicarbonate transport system ATPase subunit
VRAVEALDLVVPEGEPLSLLGPSGCGKTTTLNLVAGLVYQGAQTEVTARLADGQRVLVSVTEPSPAPLVPGQTVQVHFPPDAFMVLG